MAGKNIIIQDPNAPASSETMRSIVSLSSRGWVSLRRFALIVGVTMQTIHTWRKAGRFEAIKVGERYRVYTAEVQRFLKEGNRK